MKKFLVVITGPTCVGKTEVAIRLAEKLNAEIISSDSRQFYRELRIGVAAPSREQMQMAKHHFVGNLSVNDYYNVSAFENDVAGFLKSHFMSAGHVIMVGGSGLYIDAVCRGIDILPDPDMDLRKKITQNFRSEGIGYLQEQLRALDPEYYKVVDRNNPNRMLRAIEVCLLTGKPYSTFRKRQYTSRDFKCIKVGLDLPREELYARIGKRVDEMIAAGLVEEVRSLIPYRDLNALNTVGYKEIFDYLDGRVTLEEAIEKIKTNTRRYAKRQLTWFRKDKEIHWFDPVDIESIMEYVTGLATAQRQP